LTWSLGSEHGAGGADQALAQRLVAIGPPLNLGDWFSNGLARALGGALLFKGSRRRRQRSSAGSSAGPALTWLRLGDQGIKPAELSPDHQLVSVEDQLSVAADDLEAAQGLEETTDRLIREGWLAFAAGP
jgi:hypothetical protein